MAKRPVAMTRAAALIAAVVAALVLGTAVVLALHADRFTLRPADWSAIRFTLLQAGLSAAVSALLAIPLARALMRRSFPGRSVLVTLMGAPFLLPVVVAVVGMLSVYGRDGLFNQALAALGLPSVSIFGLQGVVLTNVFFDLPLATRILLNGWAAIPAERFRLAETLGLPPSAQFRHIEAPMLRNLLPGAFTVVFLLCLTSFVVSLTLGGGPKATTLELAIYQALRFDFDLGRAVLLAAVQFGICLAVVLLAGRLTIPTGLGVGQDRTGHLPACNDWRLLVDGGLIALVALFLALPMVSIVREGLGHLVDLSAIVWQAALRSVGMACVSALLATSGGLCLALAAARSGALKRWIDVAAMLPMVASGLVLGTGLFLMLRPWTTPEAVAVPVTVLVNATLALPFLYRLLLPEAQALRLGYDRLSDSLGLTGIARLRHVTLPRLARPLGLGGGIAAALSMGDLGVIALFAGHDSATLPLMVHRLAGAYRMDQAAAASLLLVGLSFLLFLLCDLGGRRAAP